MNLDQRSGVLQQIRPKGDWTIVVLPDTQYYAAFPERSRIWECMTRWIAENREAYGIKLVLHVGDIVNENLLPEWERARSAFAPLRNQLPLIVAAGNHDLGSAGVGSDRQTHLNRYFAANDPDLHGGLLVETFEANHLENAAYLFDEGVNQFLILSLEFGPRDAVLSWADRMVQRFPEREVLLVTHEHIDQASSLDRPNGFSQPTVSSGENSPYSYGIHTGPGSVNCGQQVWEKLVRKHENFAFVFNGHYKPVFRDSNGDLQRLDDITAGYRCDSLGKGGFVHAMCFNAQWAPNGGDGWMRLLRFTADGSSVYVQTFSPWRAARGQHAWRHGREHTFTLRRAGHHSGKAVRA